MFGWLKRKRMAKVAVPVNPEWYSQANYPALTKGLASLSKKALQRLVFNLAMENHKLTMLVAQKKIVIKGDPKTRKPIDSKQETE